MLPRPQLDPRSAVPLYRQLYDFFGELLRDGKLVRGERLPATRDLAGTLGLNRATVSAAYELLEAEGLITRQVGRGSFVTGGRAAGGRALDWARLLERPESVTLAPPMPVEPGGISFASSRPAEDLFPLDDFRSCTAEVMAGAGLRSILQLGSPSGYEPLRTRLIENARAEGTLKPGDDVVVTNGCQQALDLLARVLLRPGDAVAIEDPVYPGLRNLLAQCGARLVGVPAGASGMDIAYLEQAAARESVKLIIATSDFQNPTGATLPLGARRDLLRVARAAGAVLVENDIYGDLRYAGEPVPPLKRLDEDGGSVVVRSFSKIAFPGLRVGWVVGPKPLIDRLAEAKQLADLHSDQLSQAVLLRFLESGRLAAHLARVVAAGTERLAAALAACRQCLPAGAVFTRPEGGMNLWVELPPPLDAGELLARAEREKVAYLPGKYFAVSRPANHALRLSFANLEPARIRKGLEILGEIFSSELERTRTGSRYPAPAVV